MNAFLAATVLAAVVSASVPQPPGLSLQQIESAIRDGRAGRTQQATCTTTITSQGFYFEVRALGSIGRIMRDARLASRRRLPFSAEHVGSSHLAPHVTVSVMGHATEPSDPGPIRAFPGEIAPPEMLTRYGSPGSVGFSLAGTSFVSHGQALEVPLDTFLALGERVEVKIRNRTVGETSCWLQTNRVSRH